MLTDGNWWSPIAVEMDMDTESSFDPETISLLGAYEFARRASNKVEINTDCEGARSTIKGSKGNYKALLSGWELDENITVKKVKAHPEMWRWMKRGTGWRTMWQGVRGKV